MKSDDECDTHENHGKSHSDGRRELLGPHACTRGRLSRRQEGSRSRTHVLALTLSVFRATASPTG